VYLRGLWQIVFPRTLSPDYSMPQEPMPEKAIFPESVLGALLMVGPPLVGAWLALKNWRARDTYRAAEQRLLSFGLMAWPAAFFPVSNIPKVLPTCRAERFWYTPALATSVVIAILLVYLARRAWESGVIAMLAFVIMQGAFARKHANHFRDDLVFWEAAARAVPNSAKAHLNYSVMLGARAVELRKWTYEQAQEARLIENVRATELAPHWDMAFIYVGDTLCQLNRFDGPDGAWSWYQKGFHIAPDNTGFVALALQCMSDHNQIMVREKELKSVAYEADLKDHWVRYIIDETLERERKCRGYEEEEWEEPEPLDITNDDDKGVARESGSGSASASMSASGAPSGSATRSPSASTSVSASASASESASESASAAQSAATRHERKKVFHPGTNTDCGVPMKWRPRGLDQGPQE
jgi:hypothetical protein